VSGPLTVGDRPRRAENESVNTISNKSQAYYDNVHLGLANDALQRRRESHRVERARHRHAKVARRRRQDLTVAAKLA